MKYRFTVEPHRHDDKTLWEAESARFPGCAGFGETAIEAVSKLEELEAAAIANGCMEINLFDKVAEYPNCTVQVLENSYTGKVSVGWWKNKEAKT